MQSEEVRSGQKQSETVRSGQKLSETVRSSQKQWLYIFLNDVVETYSSSRGGGVDSPIELDQEAPWSEVNELFKCLHTVNLTQDTEIFSTHKRKQCWTLV